MVVLILSRFGPRMRNVARHKELGVARMTLIISHQFFYIRFMLRHYYLGVVPRMRNGWCHATVSKLGSEICNILMALHEDGLTPPILTSLILRQTRSDILCYLLFLTPNILIN